MRSSEAKNFHRISCEDCLYKAGNYNVFKKWITLITIQTGFTTV